MKPLSKSQYARGLQCPKSLWLYRHRKDLQDAPDAHQQAVFDAGTSFGQLAQQRFPGGVLIAADHKHPEDALAQTAQALADGAEVLYEAAFLHDDVLVRADILFKVDGGWALVEVKSGTKVEPQYLPDVAIQRYVLAGAGLPLQQVYLMHANAEYVRRGDLQLVSLFTLADVREASADALAAAPVILKALKAAADAAEAPAADIGEHCAKPYDCDFRGHCWAGVPEYSVFNIPYMKMDKKLELYRKGVRHVHDVDPAAHGVTDKRSLRPIEAARSGKIRVDAAAIAAFLNGLTYPLAHLDFESDNPVVPPFDGLRPYMQMPFQASVRVQHERGGPLEEHAYLGDGARDPRPGLVDFLCAALPTRGTVLAYYKPFESARLTELATAQLYPAPQANRLVDAVQRLQDLADPFSKGWYQDPAFKGRWSIKAVLPALVPGLSYEGLLVKDGTAAMAAYAELRDPATSPERRAQLEAGLKAYCGQDTLGMVKILERLYAVAGAVAA